MLCVVVVGGGAKPPRKLKRTRNCRDVKRAKTTISSPHNTKKDWSDYMNKIANIDTIYILVDVEEFEQKEILDYLREEKEKALLGANSTTTYKHLISINDLMFQLLPNGSQGYSYILRNNGYEIKVAQRKAKLDAFYPIQVRISAEYLWAYGILDSWSLIYNWLVETFGNVVRHKVCRIDLCCHIENIDFITNYEKVYKGKFKNKEVFYSGKQANAITFGSRKNKKIYCRIYNKTLEIQQTRKKHWFKEIWKKNNLNAKNVWNVEFELKSDILREFSLIEIPDIINNLKELWKYCTNEYLVKVDRTNQRIERCSINKEWKEIQKAYDNFNSIGLIHRNKQINIDAKALIPNIIGGITSYSARTGDLDITQAFNKIYEDSQKYFKNL